MKKVYFFASLLLFAFCFSCNSSSSAPQSITYATLNYPAGATNSSTYLTGIRGVTNSSNVYISGIYAAPGDSVTQGTGLIYEGPISGGGTWKNINYPSSAGVTVTSTALYGPNNGVGGNVQIVGNYTTSENGAFDLGLLYQGPTDGSGTWTTLNPQSLEAIRTVKNTIAHSTMGGLVVGNYDTDLVTGKAFIYNIAESSYVEIVKENAVSVTAYGIWHNGGTSYTIAGGFSDVNDGGIDTAYLVDYDSDTQAFTHWTSFTYNNQPSVLTHFEGITTDTNRGYNLVADALSGTTVVASFVNVPRTSTNEFGTATWTPYAYPGSALTSANTVYLNYALGIYEMTAGGVPNGYVTTIP